MNKALAKNEHDDFKCTHAYLRLQMEERFKHLFQVDLNYSAGHSATFKHANYLHHYMIKQPKHKKLNTKHPRKRCQNSHGCVSKWTVSSVLTQTGHHLILSGLLYHVSSALTDKQHRYYQYINKLTCTFTASLSREKSTNSPSFTRHGGFFKLR